MSLLIICWPVAPVVMYCTSPTVATTPKTSVTNAKSGMSVIDYAIGNDKAIGEVKSVEGERTETDHIYVQHIYVYKKCVRNRKPSRAARQTD
jgi:hypothetical protein